MSGASQSDKHRGRRRERTGTGTSGAAGAEDFRGHRASVGEAVHEKGHKCGIPVAFPQDWTI